MTSFGSYLNIPVVRAPLERAAIGRPSRTRSLTSKVNGVRTWRLNEINNVVCVENKLSAVQV